MERAALFQAESAVRDAFLGNVLEAKRGAASALELSEGKDVRYGAAFALALCGGIDPFRNHCQPTGTEVAGGYIDPLQLRPGTTRSGGAESWRNGKSAGSLANRRSL